MKFVVRFTVICLVLGLIQFADMTGGRVTPVFAAVDCNEVGIICKRGVLNSDETWTAGDVIVIEDTVTVGSAATLTIQAGAIVKFQERSGNGYRKFLTINGRLEVNGTASNKVYFTSNRDESIGGDTNGTAEETPVAGDWGAIFFNPGSTGTINNAEIHYAGRNYYSGDGLGAIHLNGSSPVITNVKVVKSHWAAISANPTDIPTITGFSSEQTPIGGLEIRGGEINSDTSWRNTDIAYIPTGSVTVNDTLTVAAGAKLKFYQVSGNGYRRFLTINGRLEVNGTVSNKVYITSNRDESIGGDTNGTAEETPISGDWGSIIFNDGSTGIISNAEIHYAGRNYYSGDVYGAIHLNGSSPTITNLKVVNGHWAAISANPIDTPAITGFSSEKTPLGGLVIRAGEINSDTNWTNTSIAYIPVGTVTVNEKLTIAAGAKVKFLEVPSNGNRRFLTINGRLEVNGATDNKVYFTSNRDESIGGDTNGTAEGTPAAGDWGAIYFNDGSTGAINNAEIHYAGRGYYSNNYYGAIHSDGGDVVVNGIAFNNNYWYAVGANIYDQPSISNVTFLSNDKNGMILYGNTINTDVTLNSKEIVHVINNDVTIVSGATLNIGAGVVVKFNRTSSSFNNKVDLIVEGTLNVNGTAAEKVYLTSLYDDTIPATNGDTNGDGGATVASPGDWKSIHFKQGSGGTINHAVVRYGGYRDDNGAIHLASASPTIMNSTFRSNTVGVYGTGTAASTVSLSDLFYNTQFAIVAADTSQLQASGNWWGDGLGPNLGGSNPAGQAVSGAVTTANWEAAPRHFTLKPTTLNSAVIINNSVGLFTSGSGTEAVVNPCSKFYDNSQYGILARYESQVSALRTWWGHADGPSTDSVTAGDLISGLVSFIPWALDSQCTVFNGVSAITGQVTNVAGQPLSGIWVLAYREVDGGWQNRGATRTRPSGSYDLTVPAGTVRVYFFDPSQTYQPEYYNDSPTLAGADDVIAQANATQANIDAVLEEPPPPPLDDVTGCANFGVNPETGQIVLSVRRGCQDMVTLTRTEICDDGSTPQNVRLRINDRTFAMTSIGNDQYQVSIQVPGDLPSGNPPYTLVIERTCNGESDDQPLGDWVVYDPSGLIIDRNTNQPISGAIVNLYRVPEAMPDQGGNTNDCRTIQTRPASTGGIYGAWSGLPGADLDVGAWQNPIAGPGNGLFEINPTVNPQITGSDGRYGWDVVEGCWYISVSALGYDILVSPVVGVPSAVTDLDLSLSPTMTPSIKIFLPIVGK